MKPNKPSDEVMAPERQLAALFAEVVACDRCPRDQCRNLLRDTVENVPQPGYVGVRYWERRVLLIGQNPGNPNPSLLARDQDYTAALRALREEPSLRNYRALTSILEEFVPLWPVQQNYFPLEEAGLTLEEIAYCNVVRCRTHENKRPSAKAARYCVKAHLQKFLHTLKPRIVVFVGKYGYDHAKDLVRRLDIPCAVINRKRSLSADERQENRDRVVELLLRPVTHV